MHIVRLILGIMLLLIILGFVLLNWHAAPLNFYVVNWQLPVAVIVLCSFVIGVFVGIIFHAIRKWQEK